MSERICGPALTNISTATLFTGVDETGRMKDLRINITKVRKIWQSDSRYSDLMTKIKSYPLIKTLSPSLQAKIGILLDGYSDWADMNYNRPSPPRKGFPAIELYCSQDGYQFFFGLFNSIFRQKEIDDDLLLIATALVELVTIELYNLRLANIGNPYYENFQAVTYRGMTVASDMAKEYRKAADHPDLSKRHFAVPLGFTSSSTARETMEEFARINEGQEQMHWVIHVHGIDPELLRRYHERYDDSIVTSITAMPVGQIAELRGEREVLLRGAFFHIVHMETQECEGKLIHTLQLVAMNTNRDHGTELALDEGAKQEQRNFFRNMILASRFQLCASLVKPYSQVEAEKYDELARSSLQRIDDSEYEISAASQSDFKVSLPDRVLTWYGDVTGRSFPANYYSSRMQFHSATRAGHWSRVRKMIEKEYDWEIADWLNAISLSDLSTGHTLLHEMACHGSPSNLNKVERESWAFLLQKLNDCEVWKTLKSADTLETAEEIAIRHGFSDLAALLKPRILHTLHPSLVQRLETQLYELINKFRTKNKMNVKSFRMPQLSILTEMKTGTSLWVPMPKAYGGFLVMLQGKTLMVEEIETEVELLKPRRTRYFFGG